MLVVFSHGLGFWLVCFLNCLGLAIKITLGRHCKAEMASLPNPNQLYAEMLPWLRPTSHIPQVWRAEQSPGKLYRQVMAGYSEGPLGARVEFGTQLGLSDCGHQPEPPSIWSNLDLWLWANPALGMKQHHDLSSSQSTCGSGATSQFPWATIFALCFFFLNEQFYFLTFISIQICCTVLVSSAFLLVQFLEPPSLLPFLSMFETSFNQPWSNHTPYDCRPWNMQLHQDLLLKQWFVIWSLVDCLSENPYPQETLK